LYIDFTEKCYNLLEDNGELVFIVPSDFLKLTSSSSLLNIMMNNGTFTHIYHPNVENLFENASIDVIIFRYCKNPLLEKKVLYNNKPLYITNSNGLITFSENKNYNTYLLQDYFDVFVGIVSGKEEVYKNDKLGNIKVLNGDNTEINNYLSQYKTELMDRGIRKFNETNWFEWGALRNISTVEKNLEKDCIYMYNLTRKTNVAFIGKIGYFGGGLLMLKPKKQCDLNKVVLYLNSSTFKTNFTFSGRFKIGQRHVCNSYIPDENL
jgi:adenine-specific DNA-methyltransferase